MRRRFRNPANKRTTLTLAKATIRELDFLLSVPMYGESVGAVLFDAVVKTQLNPKTVLRIAKDMESIAVARTERKAIAIDTDSLKFLTTQAKKHGVKRDYIFMAAIKHLNDGLKKSLPVELELMQHLLNEFLKPTYKAIQELGVKAFAKIEKIYEEIEFYESSILYDFDFGNMSFIESFDSLERDISRVEDKIAELEGLLCEKQDTRN